MIQLVIELTGHGVNERCVVHDSGVKVNFDTFGVISKYVEIFKDNPDYLIVGECLVLHGDSFIELNIETNTLTVLSGHSVELTSNMTRGLATKYRNWKAKRT